MAIDVMATAVQVEVTDVELIVKLADGRTVTVPLVWFPRLMNGTSEHRRNFRLIGRGEGIHWPDLDEGLSTAGLLRTR